MNPRLVRNPYQQVAAQTAPPGQLVLMLFDGAVRFLERALAGFDLEDPLEFNQTIHNNITRALDIIHELNYSLNLARGGELAVTLRDLYSYFDRRLQQSNRTKQPDGIKEVLRRLTVLREAWAEMLRNGGGYNEPNALSREGHAAP